MEPLRDLFLWASQSPALAERLPRLAPVRATVARFLPGETADAALAAADRLAERGIACAFTELGENVTDADQAAVATERYLDLLDRIAERGLDGEVSVKLTHLGLDLDPDLAHANAARIAERAEALGGRLWLDMESSEYVDRTLAAYRRLLARSPRTGVCVQAYLRRTPQDVADLLPLDPSLRLVKGAYREPSSIAYPRRAQVRTAYQRLALEILRRRPQTASGRLVLGTHDVELVRAIDDEARTEGIDRRAFEVEMLYGIRVPDQERLAREGFRVRVLIAFGTRWYAWFMRRLAERPANALLALRALVARPSPGATDR
ncbi:MAG: proline dehydrogenase [Actinomycetota bacterium]|nr:MAG: proline dehydrogenase [Actinomycetota bacterium]